MKKRIFSLLLVLCMVFAMLPVTAFAASTVHSGTCGVNLTWTLDDEGTLTISGEGTMYNYGRVDAPWIGHQEQVLSAVVEDGVTSIGDYAFEGCKSLTAIDLPESVVSIGHAAFHSCSSLQSVEIPAAVTSISAYAFYGCSSLPSVAIPAGVTSIGNYAFANCSGLPSIDLPAGLTAIGEYAFHGCSSLSSIAIPAGVTSIAAGMFSTCKNLTSVDLPAGVTSIGGSAFYNCNSLTTIDLPAGVTSIGDYAFSNSNKLTSIEIPAGVTSISHSTFHGCSKLASVDLPAGLTSIGGSAFSYCINLKSIDLPAGVTSIGDYAFRSCRSLKSIDIPKGVTYIGDSAFAYCEDLTKVTFKGDAPSIDAYAFEDVTAYAYYPDGNATWTEEVKQNYSGTLTWEAYDNADSGEVASGTCGVNLTWTLDAEGTLTISGEGAMYDYSSGTAPWSGHKNQILSVVAEKAATSIGDYAFEGCKSLTAIDLPESVASIGNFAFYGCSNLTSIDIPAGVTSIGDYAFHGCSSLTSIAIPAGVTSIDPGMFSTCSSLTSIALPAGVTSIGDDAFAGCMSLTSIEIPAGVSVIGNYVFHGCSSLTSIELPAGVTHIGNAAFRDCSSLVSIEIPAGVTSIGNRAFCYCVSLKAVTFRGNAPSIDSNAFSGTTTTAYYPAGDATWTENVKQNYGGSITWIGESFGGFGDVAPGSYYEIPVQWAVEKGITSGVDEDHFAPNAPCTRAQVVTFLWRAAGSPEPASGSNPFVDVAADSYYYKAVLWAVEKGITSGNDATHFAPNASCNRAQVVAFLWRFRGRPASGGNNIFTDVEAGSYYYDAVLWAVENGITSGMGDGTFGTNAACNRGQIVTFLYRTLA